MQKEPQQPRGWLLHAILFAVAWAPLTELLRIIFTNTDFEARRLLVNVAIALVIGPLFFRFWGRRLPPAPDEERGPDAS